ncbi:MAG TPA: hypothetical protein VJ598_05915 [Albitalea sp.]|nr:hypothetical protein [Albitalea sp.]
MSSLAPPLPQRDIDAYCLDDGPPVVSDGRSPRPEETLLMALLEQTFRDLRATRQSVRRGAELWIATPGLHAWSFWWVCAHLNLDASYLQRAGVARLARTLVPRIAASKNHAGLRAKRRPHRVGDPANQRAA